MATHPALRTLDDRALARVMLKAEMPEPRSSAHFCPNYTAAHGHGSGVPGVYGYRMDPARCSAPPIARRCHETCPRQAPERLVASQIEKAQTEVKDLVKTLKEKRAALAQNRRTLKRVKKRDGIA